MKTVTIKHISLTNYKGKGTHNFSSNFGKVTRISGRNRAGKSSVADSYAEAMTGKLMNGKEPDGIRPHDSKGKDINRADIIREITLEVDGKETTIQKVTYQTWRKPRGQAEEVFDGNHTKYVIDGFESKNQKDFAEWQQSIADSETLLMCSNARSFLNLLQKSTAEARKLLESLAGFSVEKFIEENPQYAEINEICKGHKIEDVKKQLNRNLSAQKKECDKVSENLKYEQTREISHDIELSACKLAINGYTEELKALDDEEKSLDEATKVFSDLQREIMELQYEQSSIANKATEEVLQARRDLEHTIENLKNDKSGKELQISTNQMKNEQDEKQIKFFSDELQKAQDEYKSEMSKEYREVAFNDDYLICPTCGQELPQDQKEQKKAEWDKRQEENKANFESEKKHRLGVITERGTISKGAKETALKSKSECETAISELKAEVEQLEKQISENQQTLSAMPEKADFTNNADYQKISKQIAEKEKKLAEMNNGADKRAEIREKRKSLNEKIADLKADIKAQQTAQEQKDEKVAELEAELKRQAQLCTDVERKLDLLKDFSIKKNQALAEQINPYFQHFHFEFTDYTQSGDVYETLKIINNDCGTDFMGDLNTGDKILIEIFLCVGLQKLNNLNLPIFSDDTESLDSDRIPKLDQQLVLLKREDIEGLKIEILEE